ncbi:MAG TPA: hypothetical protein DCQ76_01345, partial [Ruminococcaceae bacterium]|nr:hypothetical protein [Oscillospiraceae bacterium]
MSDLRSFTPVEPNTAGKALIAVQTVVTRIKELIVGSVAKGVNKDEITRQLNKLISDFCKTIDNEALREQNRKALVTAAKKWYYTTTTTFEIVNRNMLSMSGNIYRIGANDSTSHITELRPRQDRGINLGTPLIADYKRSVRLAMKALAADPPLVVTRRDGKTYTMPIRNRAEIAVRYDANVKDLQKFASSGVDLVWTSQHPNCSPRCKDYQGKLWSISGKSGKINGITYRPLSEAIQGKLKDGNGIITGYNCRHRLIEYTANSHPPQELSEAEIKKEYAIDKKQRAYENNIRHMKTNERLLRATGDIEGAKALRKRWRRATKLYQAYSFENGRPFHPDRCVIDEVEIRDKNYTAEENLQNSENDVKMDIQDFVPAATVTEAEEQAKAFSANVNYAGVKNVDALNTVNKTLKRLTTEYPIDKLDLITVKKLGRSHANASANAKGLNIDLNYLNKNPDRVDWKSRITKYPEMIEQAQKAIESGEYPKSYVNKLKDFIKQMREEMKYTRHTVSSDSENRIVATIAHEYGHILADQYFGQINHSRLCPNYANTFKSREMVEMAYARAKTSGDIKKISMYANDNSHEFFAECFAAHINGEQLPD